MTSLSIARPVDVLARLLSRTAVDRTALVEHYPETKSLALRFATVETNHAETARRRVDAEGLRGTDLGRGALRWLQATVAALQAETVVQAGVGVGITSTALLAGVETTRGHVHSIDVRVDAPVDAGEEHRVTRGAPAGTPVADGGGPEWAVPTHLRNRWTLHEGRTQEVLPEVLVDVGEVDLYLHDSDRSRLCTSMGLEVAWARLRPGGVVCYHDRPRNGAWDEFVEQRVPEGCSGTLAPGLEYAIKPGSDVGVTS